MKRCHAITVGKFTVKVWASGAPRSESHPLVLSKHLMAYTRYLFAWVMRAPSYTRKEKGTTARAKNPTNACCLHSALGRWHSALEFAR